MAKKKSPAKKKSAKKKIVKTKTVALKKTKHKPAKPSKKPAGKKTASKAGKKSSAVKKSQPVKSKASKPAKAVRSGGEAKKPAERGAHKPETPPAPKPLTPEVKVIRDKLLATRIELAKMLATSKEMERNPDELNFSNEIDLASSLEGREMVFQLASRDRNELRMIDEALFKIEHGTYGVCEGCSKTIGLKRLQILPLTEFCIDCQETLEHQ